MRCLTPPVLRRFAPRSSIVNLFIYKFPELESLKAKIWGNISTALVSTTVIPPKSVKSLCHNLSLSTLGIDSTSGFPESLKDNFSYQKKTVRFLKSQCLSPCQSLSPLKSVKSLCHKLVSESKMSVHPIWPSFCRTHAHDCPCWVNFSLNYSTIIQLYYNRNVTIVFLCLVVFCSKSKQTLLQIT